MKLETRGEHIDKLEFHIRPFKFTWRSFVNIPTLNLSLWKNPLNYIYALRLILSPIIAIAFADGVGLKSVSAEVVLYTFFVVVFTKPMYLLERFTRDVLTYGIGLILLAILLVAAKLTFLSSITIFSLLMTLIFGLFDWEDSILGPLALFTYTAAYFKNDNSVSLRIKAWISGMFIGLVMSFFTIPPLFIHDLNFYFRPWAKAVLQALPNPLDQTALLAEAESIDARATALAKDSRLFFAMKNYDEIANMQYRLRVLRDLLLTAGQLEATFSSEQKKMFCWPRVMESFSTGHLPHIIVPQEYCMKNYHIFSRLQALINGCGLLFELDARANPKFRLFKATIPEAAFFSGPNPNSDTVYAFSPKREAVDLSLNSLSKTRKIGDILKFRLKLNWHKLLSPSFWALWIKMTLFPLIMSIIIYASKLSDSQKTVLLLGQVVILDLHGPLHFSLMAFQRDIIAGLLAFGCCAFLTYFRVPSIAITPIIYALVWSLCVLFGVEKSFVVAVVTVLTSDMLSVKSDIDAIYRKNFYLWCIVFAISFAFSIIYLPLLYNIESRGVVKRIKGKVYSNLSTRNNLTNEILVANHLLYECLPDLKALGLRKKYEANVKLIIQLNYLLMMNRLAYNLTTVQHPSFVPINEVFDAIQERRRESFDVPIDDDSLAAILTLKTIILIDDNLDTFSTINFTDIFIDPKN